MGACGHAPERFSFSLVPVVQRTGRKLAELQIGVRFLSGTKEKLNDIPLEGAKKNRTKFLPGAQERMPSNKKSA